MEDELLKNCIDDTEAVITELQTKIDKQTDIYQKLYDIGKNLNESLGVDDIFDIATNFVTKDLNFEKILIFKHDEVNGWFKVVKSVGYENPMEKKILKIINLLLSGEVIENLRVSQKPILHSEDYPNEIVSKLIKSLFLNEAYFELFGGDIDIPFGLIVVGNSKKELENHSRIILDKVEELALGNFITQFSNTINNIVFYKAWNDEKSFLEENIKKRTQEIQSQKDTFEKIYQTSKDGIAILDIETTAFLDVNQAYGNITGYTTKELLSTSCMKLSIEEDMKKSKLAIQEILTKGYITNFIKHCIHKNGKIIITSMSISLMESGKEMLVSLKDITEMEEAKGLIEKSHKNIRDSIKFASLIQGALLPEDDVFPKYFKDSFTFWLPKDTVGGDIYLAITIDKTEEILLMVFDGAGHGVPGAFVTMLVKAIENQIKAELQYGHLAPNPAVILEYFNTSMKTMLKQDKIYSTGRNSNAGFDGGVLYYNKRTNKCKYAGAKTPLYIIQDGKLEVLKSDRKNVGFIRTKIDQKYTEYDIDIKDGTQLYLCTDGIADQEGEADSRYGKTKFEKLILANHTKSISEQKKLIQNDFKTFKSTFEQSDDVTVVGLKF